MTRDPLAELVEYLARGGDVPLAWVVEHAPSGDLRRLWETAADPAVLVELAGCLVERAVLVRVACACARQALWWVPTREPRPIRAIESAERWADGLATPAEVERALLDARAYARDHDDYFGAGACHAAASVTAARVDEAVREASDAVSAGFGAVAARFDEPERARRIGVLATAVRAHLPCPTVGQLRASMTRG